MTKTVLLGAAGSGTAFALAVRLRASFSGNVRIVGTDVNPPELVATTVLCDVMETVPPACTTAFGDAITDLARRHGVDTYVPVLNEELGHAAVLAARPDFCDVDVWSSPLAAGLAGDKAAAATWLDRIGVPTPKNVDIAASPREAGVFVKPLAGTGSHGARTTTVSEVLALDEEARADLLFQELCDPPEVTVDSFFDAATGFQLAVCRERIETKAGVCTKTRVFFDSALSAIARQIGEAMGQRGTICFQVMRAGERWVVTDLNMRPGAGTALSCAAGHDVLSAAFACRWGRPYEKYFSGTTDRNNVFVTRQYTEFVMT